MFLHFCLRKGVLGGGWKHKNKVAIENDLKLPLEIVFEAGDGIRTRDIYLGKVALYH